MKPWQLLIVTTATALFLWLAVSAYHQAHPDLDHGYSRSEFDGIEELDKTKPVILHRENLVSVNAFAYLYPDYNMATAKALPFKAKRKR